MLASGCLVAINAAADGLPRAAADSPADAAINGKVAAALMSDPGLLGARINVDTRMGVVSLDGSVEGPRELRRALELAAGVDGVRRVDNRLEVLPVR